MNLLRPLVVAAKVGRGYNSPKAVSLTLSSLTICTVASKPRSFSRSNRASPSTRSIAGARSQVAARRAFAATLFDVLADVIPADRVLSPRPPPWNFQTDAALSWLRF